MSRSKKTESIKTIQPVGANEAVELENQEAAYNPTPEEFQAEIERLNAIIAEQQQALSDQEPVIDEDAALFYNGIQQPDYRLKTVYVPYNAQGISKKPGYDPDMGENYVYTPVQVCHMPPGAQHHSFETFNIRLDSRVVVPAFVAEVLGTRCDAQDYYPEAE